MNEENNSIHDFDISLICEYFTAFERQGPGSPEVTLNALHFVDNLTESSKIADLGCGTGGQTMILAQHSPGQITGIDLFPAFIDLFNENARKLNLSDKVKGITGSMDDLPFHENELDLIWSEGAIYNIGFDKGINYWKKFLKKGGYLAVTEACWFTDERPAEIQDFWQDAYPEIDTVQHKISALEKAGYESITSFNLPENCWTDHFYELQSKAQKLFLQKYPENPSAAELVRNMIREAALYNKYSEYYGYTFFIAGKK